MKSPVHRLALFAAFLALLVIVLGAYVRLSDAGLGCPDWPGCYGQLTWPAEPHEISQADEAFPERPVESDKAWKEMVHRYLAGALVLLVAWLNVLAWRRSDRDRGVRLIAGALFLLILFQAALGMWTVTLKLLPLVVMAHLLGGLATFSLLLWLAWRSGDPRPDAETRALTALRVPILAGLLILVAQLGLGGWTSANYAALACPDFPTCQGELWPDADYADGFVMWRGIGVDYEGGVLDLRSRVAIHFAHRIGALVAFVFIGLLALRLIARPVTRQDGLTLGALLVAQIVFGIQNVVLQLPLLNAVVHNATGALLLAMMLWLTYRSASRPTVFRDPLG